MTGSAVPSRIVRGPLAWWIIDAFLAALFAVALAATLHFLLAGTSYLSLIAAGTMAVAALARAWVQARVEDSGIEAANRAKAQVRRRLFPALFRSRRVPGRLLGEDVATAVDQVGALTAYLGRFEPLRRAAVVSPLLVAAMVMLASPVSAAILVATLLPFGLGMVLAGGAARQAADAQVSALGRLSGLFVDRVRSLPIILAFGAEERVARQVDTAVQEVADRTYGVLRIAFLSSGTLEFFSALSVALVAVYCGFQMLDLLPFRVPEHLDLPRAVFALALAPEFYLPLRRLAAAYHDKQLGEAAMTAIDARCADLPTEPDKAISVVPEGSRALEIELAVIRYDDGTSVGPFSLTVARGEMVALSGPTGSGKSSLFGMIVGLAPLASGRLLLDGADMHPGAFNHVIAWAGQHVMLLPGTIADNIALACPDAVPGRIRAAAERAGLGALIASRPDGLDTVIDPRGSGLSGGERRRIGIARALLVERSLMVLDEPTADLDRDTADALIAVLKEVALERAVLVASHDPSLIAAADRKVAIR
ncbi:ATP-binding cassette domain-containing protein [Sphingomonas sp. RT2P30]|uniref:ABC transporter ATP-binding protein/permease n=1 Tax=Parasphingomonas halimpatiens TaxID=3096162 RepID=UPI002FCBCC7A